MIGLSLNLSPLEPHSFLVNLLGPSKLEALTHSLLYPTLHLPSLDQYGVVPSPQGKLSPLVLLALVLVLVTIRVPGIGTIHLSLP